MTAQASCIGIVGLGLIGGSLARALKHRDPSYRIIAVEPREDTREAALRARVVDVALAHPARDLEACAVVFLAMPVGALESTLTALGPCLSTMTLLTDVCGIKQSVAAQVARLLPHIEFVGGHPMAGGTEGGFGHSRSDLFTGAAVAICPAPGAQGRVAALAELWRAVGARPTVMDAETHDRLVALSSHLPYLSAVAITELIAARPEAATLSGNGLRHATRQASFAPEIMAASALSNPYLPEELRRLAVRLEQLARLLETSPDELGAVVAQARRHHQRLLLES